MNDIEKRARELLVQSFQNHGMDDAAGSLDYILGKFESGTLRACVDAIIAALTPPEGFVFVPVETQKDAERYQYIRWIAAGDPVEFGIIEDAAFPAHYGDAAQFDLNIDALIAARPEVP